MDDQREMKEIKWRVGYFLLAVPIVICALNLYTMVIPSSKLKLNFFSVATQSRSHAAELKADGGGMDPLPFCNAVTEGDLQDNLPLQFYCQDKSKLSGFSAKAAMNAWQRVSGFISKDLALSALKRSAQYEITGLNMTLWSTRNDEGAPLVLREEVENVYKLDGARGKGLAIDLGSNLGAVTIQISRLYPEWTIISAEAMPITYLYQTVNLWLNAPRAMESGRIIALPAAVGADGATATYQFREDSLTSSRDWNPDSESWRTTYNLTLRTVSLLSLLRLAGVGPSHIDLLKLDCEGCEYDVIPALTASQMDAISRVAAETHYSDMLKNGRPGPPRARVELAHERLCRRWRVCVDMLTGQEHPPPPPPPWTNALVWLAWAGLYCSPAAAACGLLLWLLRPGGPTGRHEPRAPRPQCVAARVEPAAQPASLHRRPVARNGAE